VSHAHGQGYADLHFVIPELVERLEVMKGPYAAEQGDFATAGSVNLVSRRAVRESSAAAGYGSFNTFRGLVVAAPQREGSVQSYVAAEAYRSDGPFLRPEQYERLNLMARASCAPSPRTELSLQLQAYSGAWFASGQIPLRAVKAGTLSRFGNVDPTEGGASQRHSALVQLHHHDEGGGELRLRAWLVRYRLNLYSNFTFFAVDPEHGDQVEQADARVLSGFDARYEFPALLAGMATRSSVGLRLRNDDVENGLFHTERRVRLAPVLESRLSEGSLGVYAEEDVAWTGWLRTVAGVRADLFGFQVAGTDAAGVRQAALVSPRASAVVTPVQQVDLFLNAGRGFHSNDARGVVRPSGAVRPLTPALGYELGARARLPGRVDLAASAWALDLESELVWVGDEGTTEARGATTRRGLEVEVRWRPLPWLRADADVTWSRARFSSGAYVPLAPEWTWSGGVQADHPSGAFGSVRWMGMTDRPANEEGSLVAQGFQLVDLEAGWRWRFLQASLSVKNLLDTAWRQAQFANVSRLKDEPAPVEDLHFTPGYPRAVMATVTAFMGGPP
jgi:outer membrane receptor protein involved in Fe transport